MSSSGERVHAALTKLVELKDLENRARWAQIAATDAAGYRIADAAAAAWKARRDEVDGAWEDAAKALAAARPRRTTRCPHGVSELNRCERCD